MTAPVASRARAAIGRGLLTSAALHAAALGTVLAVVRGAPRTAPPPVYRVALVAAPPSAGPVGSAPTTSGRAAVASAPATASAPASATGGVSGAAFTKPTAAKSPPTKGPASSHSPPPPAPAKPAATLHAAAHAAPHRNGALKPTTIPKPSAPTHSAGPATLNAKPAVKPPKPTPSTATAPRPAGSTTKATAAAPAVPTTTAGHPSAAGSPAARGHDPADVRVVGLAFPYPGYLDNLVRQMRVRFSPTQTRTPLRADLAFVIARDGSVSAIRVVRGSGNYGFDLEAQGAVEAAGEARAFGPLPDGFHGTSLPVTFSFDPRSP